MSSTKRRNSVRTSYQPLEPRQLLAGNVFVKLDAGNLTVVGNHESNAFSINLNATTPELLVQGQDGTSVRFADSIADGFSPSEIVNLRVYTNAGDDAVTIDGRSNLARGELVVSLGFGDDSLYMVGGVFDGNATVYAGANHDSVFIHNTSFGGNLALIKGAGADVSVLDSVKVAGQTRFIGQFGSDAMLVRNSTFSDGAYFELGEGPDRFVSHGSTYESAFSVRGREGQDVSTVVSANTFLGSKNIQSMEAGSLVPFITPDKFGQLKAALFDFGPEIRSFTTEELQSAMGAFAVDFSAELIELDLDEATQFVSVKDATPTVSAIWDQAVPQSENTDLNKSVAMSFAAFRVLEDLFADQSESFEAVMRQLGFNPMNQSTDATTPAGVGNRMAASLLEYRHEDGSNQLGNDPNGQAGVAYSDIFGYVPVNAAGDTTDIESWTPEFVPIDSDPGNADRIQQFLTPHWGGVNTFSLSSGSEFRPVAPEPFLLVDGTVNLSLGTITLGDGSTVNIDKSLIGTVINPEFISQTEEVIEISANLDDEDKLIAEFWEDGGGTAFPPGTFMTFGQFVSARDNHTVDDDAKM